MGRTMGESRLEIMPKSRIKQKKQANDYEPKKHKKWGGETEGWKNSLFNLSEINFLRIREYTGVYKCLSYDFIFPAHVCFGWG